MLAGMRDTELYRHLLGIESPWTVSRVELDVKGGRVDVWAEHAKGARFACPECGREATTYDHEEERSWRHLDSCQFATYLHARPPRVKCEEHGVKQARLSWAEPHSRFTLLFERLAIDVLREMSITGACRLLGLSWDEAHHLMERAVARGQERKTARPVRYLGVDEKATRKGHKYMTLVCDLERRTVEHVEEGRTKESLDAFYQSLSTEHREQIEAVAMDMWAPYVASTTTQLPAGADKIVFDRFHIMKHMNDAVDKVRRVEHRLLRDWGHDTLKGTKHLWLYAQENVPERDEERFRELRRLTLKTGRAWMIKEDLRWLWSCASKERGKAFFKRWDRWAMRSRLAPVIGVARMLRSKIRNVLTYFEHPITNAISEAINSVVQTVKKNARGFRSFVNFKTAVFFHCGGLDLYPRYRATHGLPG